MKTIKLGDTVIPTVLPELKGKVTRIQPRAGWNDETLYTLENGTVWSKLQFFQN